MNLCRHCSRNKVTRPRGLCDACYYTPAISDLYPTTSKYGRRGTPNHTGPRPLPTPTGAEPGTEAKIVVLEKRSEAGQDLWHPADPRINCKPSWGRRGVWRRVHAVMIDHDNDQDLLDDFDTIH